MSTVREFLKQVSEKKGYGVTDADLIELLTEGNKVHSEGRDEHRWYICETVVCEVDGTYIQFTDYIITGDGNMQDMDLEYDLDSAKIVERKEREITEVYYE
jgi:hypothetical protein